MIAGIPKEIKEHEYRAGRVHTRGVPVLLVALGLGASAPGEGTAAPQGAGVADRAQPKILYSSRSQKQLFALGLQGHQMVRKDGSWKEGPMEKPFFDLPESEPGQSLDDVILSRDGSALMLVESRNHSIRSLTMSEYLAAAERFLPVEELAVLKKKAEVELPTDGYQLVNRLRTTRLGLDIG